MVKEKKVQNKIGEGKKAAAKANIGMDPWSVILYPHMAEKSMSLVDLQNKLVFVVKKAAKKQEIKKAFEKLFDVKVESVCTENTIQGQKKAFIKLDSNYSAADIATRLGIL